MKKSQVPHKIRKKKSILKSRFFWLFVLFFTAAAGSFYIIVFSAFFQIKTIAVSGEKEINKEEIQSLVWRELEKSMLFFRSKSVFLASPVNIQKKLLVVYPEIGRAEVAWKFPDIINIAIEERFGIANWLKENRCFLIDNDGVIFKEIQANEALVKIRDERRIFSFALGERIIEKDKLREIMEIWRKIKKDIKINVEELIVFDERLNIKTAEGWEIFFDTEGDINWQLTKLSLVLEKKIPPEKRENLEYIDLRFSRIFYKYRD